MKGDWIIANDGEQGEKANSFECKRCGDVCRYVLPIDLSIWLAMAKEFEKKHKHCEANP